MKEFKEWDKRFTRSEIEEQRAEYARVAPIDAWPHVLVRASQETVRYAVYEAFDAPQWQKLRVSLKGLETAKKLGVLNWYLHRKKWSMCREVRVDNYIGALKRAGILNDNLEVVK